MEQPKPKLFLATSDVAAQSSQHGLMSNAGTANGVLSILSDAHEREVRQPNLSGEAQTSGYHDSKRTLPKD